MYLPPEPRPSRGNLKNYSEIRAARAFQRASTYQTLSTALDRGHERMEKPMTTEQATTNEEIRSTRSHSFKRGPLRERRIGRLARNGSFSIASLILVVLLILAPAAGAVNYSSQYYNGATNYNVDHWSSWYVSRGGEASATPFVGNTICGYSASGSGIIKCNSMPAWSNQISYSQQTAKNVCSIYSLGWGGSNIALACYRGT